MMSPLPPQTEDGRPGSSNRPPNTHHHFHPHVLPDTTASSTHQYDDSEKIVDEEESYPEQPLLPTSYPTARPQPSRLDSRDHLVSSGRAQRLTLLGRHIRLGKCRNRSRVRRCCRPWLLISMFVTLLSCAVLIYATTCERQWQRTVLAWNREIIMPETNMTKNGITRVWGHSHNDEMQGDNALTLALTLGFGSIEIDTWLVYIDKQPVLLAGHKTDDLDGRTLQETYLDPLLDILDTNNVNQTSSDPWIGVYQDDPYAQLQLVLDFKSDGEEMWPHILDIIKPLIERGYVTSYNTTSGTWTQAPLVIIGTGNTPLAEVYHSNPRQVFYDAPLRKLSKPITLPVTKTFPAETITFDPTIAPMASAKLPLIFHVALALPPHSVVVSAIKRYTTLARAKGIKSRWWGFAHQPRWVRHRMWNIQRQGGTDWINGDELVELSSWLHRKVQH